METETETGTRGALAAPSPRSLTKAEPRKPSMTEFEARALVARMSVIWGDWRLTTKEARDGYVAEFLGQFQFETHATVDAALSRLKGRTDRKGWPEIAEIVKSIADDRGSPSHLRTFREPIPEPLTPDEIERRKQFCELARETARRAFPFTPALDYSMPNEFEIERKPLPPADPVAEADSIARIKASLKKIRASV